MPAHKWILQILRNTFITGPWLMLTSQLGFKQAMLMILLCSPALLLCAMLTIPAMLFESPQQQAYFYFARILNQDPNLWSIFAMTCLCVVIALALPASAARPLKQNRF